MKKYTFETYLLRSWENLGGGRWRLTYAMYSPFNFRRKFVIVNEQGLPGRPLFKGHNRKFKTFALVP